MANIGRMDSKKLSFKGSFRPSACQELIRMGAKPTHCGWLRKRSVVSEILDVKWLSIAKNAVPWIQKYVVIKEGFLYVYPKEDATKPAEVLDLCMYNSVLWAHDISESEALWCFKLITIYPDKKNCFFSAASQDDMKLWMAKLKEEIDKVNNKVAKGESLDYYPEHVSFASEKGESKHVETRPDKDDDSMDEDDYLKPIQQPIKSKGISAEVAKASSWKPTKLPRTKLKEKKQSLTSPDGKSKLSSRPTPAARPRKNIRPEVSRLERILWHNDAKFHEVVLYNTTDRDVAKSMIQGIGVEGVYLIRPSRELGQMVLVVFGRGQDLVREYKIIFEQAGQTYSIDPGVQFFNIPDLLEFYYDNALPTIPVKLTLPFTRALQTSMHPIH